MAACAMPEEHRYYTGVFYPRADAMPEAHAVSGYLLSEQDLEHVCVNLPGKPVTFEHSGIAHAAHALGVRVSYSGHDVIKSLNAAAAKHPRMHAVGVVLDAWKSTDGCWRCTFMLNAKLYPRTVSMIAAGCLGELSLSHISGGTPAPLEVSLCSRAARPCCVIECWRDTLHGAQHYKALTRLPVLTEPTMDATTPPPTPMAGALAALTPEQRNLVSAAFADMEKAAALQRDAMDASTQKVALLETAANVDKDLLRSQINTFLSQIKDTTRAQYGIQDADAVANTICSDNPDTMRRTVDRLLMCCSQVMFARRGASPEDSLKRVAYDPADDAAATFEPAAPSAADQLRAALKAF